MTLLTKQEIEALLDGTAPGLVDHCLYHCGKRLAECPCMRDLAAKGALTDAAPNLARTAIDALARLEDAEAAQALVVERAEHLTREIVALEALCDHDCDNEDCVRCFHYPEILEQKKTAIRALAPDSGVAALAALRAERDRINQWRETAIVERDTYSEERDAALTRLAAAEGRVAALRLQLDQKDALYDSGFQAGVKLGWNFGVSGDEAGFQAATSSTEHVAELKRIRAALATVTPPADTGEGA